MDLNNKITKVLAVVFSGIGGVILTIFCQYTFPSRIQTKNENANYQSEIEKLQIKNEDHRFKLCML